MRKLIGLTIFVGLVLFSVAAQADDKAQVFGGYQFTHPDGGPNMSGFNGALTVNFKSHFGVTGDFSGTYGSGIHLYTYTFGPEVHAKISAIKPFAHVLIGGGRFSGNGSENGLVVLAGGGVDVGRRNFAWRVGQFDWMLTHFNGFTDKKNVRVSSGIVIRF